MHKIIVKSASLLNREYGGKTMDDVSSAKKVPLKFKNVITRRQIGDISRGTSLHGVENVFDNDIHFAVR